MYGCISLTYYFILKMIVFGKVGIYFIYQLLCSKLYPNKGVTWHKNDNFIKAVFIHKNETKYSSLIDFLNCNWYLADHWLFHFSYSLRINNDIYHTKFQNDLLYHFVDIKKFFFINFRTIFVSSVEKAYYLLFFLL